MQTLTEPLIWEENQVEIEQMLQQLPDPETLWSEEPPMESTKHWYQLDTLVDCINWHWQDRDDYFVGANLTVYYELEQLKRRKFSGPDFFVVMNTERKHRKSWVVWGEQGRYPDLIIELLSESTQRTDKTRKKDLYEQVFRTSEYFLFSPEFLEFLGFRLKEGRYVPIKRNKRGWLWSEVLGLYLGVHKGMLRFFTKAGKLVPTPAEAALAERKRAEQELIRAEEERVRAEQERVRAEEERVRAEQERVRAEEERVRADEEHERAMRLAKKLRELGVDPDEM